MARSRSRLIGVVALGAAAVGVAAGVRQHDLASFVAILVHELAHALTAEAFGGDVVGLVHHGSAGGVVVHRGVTGWGLVAVSLAGYLSEAVVGAGLIVAAARSTSGRAVCALAGAGVGFGVAAWTPRGTPDTVTTWAIGGGVAGILLLAAAVPWDIVRRIVLATLGGACIGGFVAAMVLFATGAFDTQPHDLNAVREEIGVPVPLLVAGVSAAGLAAIAWAARVALRGPRQGQELSGAEG